jgi:hypothetical protein
MHGPIKVKSPNNISKWQMGFNSAFKGLTYSVFVKTITILFGGNNQVPTDTHALYSIQNNENFCCLFKMAVMVFVNSTVLLDIDMFHLLYVAGNKRDSFKSRRTNISLIARI